MLNSSAARLKTGQRPRRVFLLAAVLLSCVCVPALLACNTPVYRYAMYNWARSPYYAFYLHKGEPDPQDSEVNKKLEELTDAEDWRVNIVFQPLDLSQEGALKRLPPWVRESWEGETEKPLPQHLILTPRGAVLHEGRLKVDDLPLLTNSPKRQELAKLLAGGNQGVLILVNGTDKEANETAAAEVRKVIQMGSEGEILPGIFPEDPDSPDAGKLKIGMLQLDPNDPQEQWFLRTLFAVEELEPEDKGKPMMFAAYGRGRALEPYVGKGITADNMIDVVMFVNSACSCEVKELNPGMDLLTDWDWNAAAMQLAQEVGEETGNEHLLMSALFGEQQAPEYVETPAQPAQATDESESEESESEQPVQVAETPATDETPTTAATEQSTAAPPTTPAAEPGFSNQMVTKLGLMLGIAAVAIVLMGLVFLRRGAG